jgi:uncharacterized protein YndB with AHSA1/START domain
MAVNTASNADREIVSMRVLPFPRERVFRAIAEPARLARWWGPQGFRNSFDQCDFRPGGDWIFVMHGPDGKDYPNRSRFEEIEEPARVVVDHLSAPHFRMVMTLSEEGAGTRLHWRQQFEDARVREQLAAVCVPANEQNFDRLQTELSAHP